MGKIVAEVQVAAFAQITEVHSLISL